MPTEPMPTKPMRCAECDCQYGGYDCNWIKSPITGHEHARIVAEKDAEIARLVSERQLVDRRIKNQRAQLAWWNNLFNDHLAAACRRRIYYPNWTPVLYRRAKARREALKGDDNG